MTRRLWPVFGLMLVLTIWIAGCGNTGAVRAPGTATMRATPGFRPIGSQQGHFDNAQGLRALAPIGSLPALDEEVWVIVKPESDPDSAAAPAEDSPGTGALMCVLPDAPQRVPMPLQHTDVSASITAYIASVQVTQQFYNPFNEKIEAVYVFPLPQNAAVNGFIMAIGERRIRGIIREREEAEQIYSEAKSQGYIASLLTQERPNLFTQSVANIEPGAGIDIEITYFNTLAYDDGWYEFVFPMVVGPRFNPPGMVDGVGAVARGASGRSGQSTELSYLRPNERSGHDIGVSVTIDAGVAIEEVRSASHLIDVATVNSTQKHITLRDTDTIPNKDFVLRYRVAGETVKTALLTHEDESGGYFTLMLYPPTELSTLQRQPLELVFVLDCSGSMSGEPIRQAKRAIERALRSLQPTDSFQIIRFSNDASTFGPAPIDATPSNIQRGVRYVRGLSGGGGTMMLRGIEAALDFPHDPERLRFVVFLTDGYIGNEAQILRAIHDRLGASRIFSFGVGSSPNRYLMDRMAKMGSGAVAYIGLNDSATDAMDRFMERISHPALTNLAIDWGGLDAHEVYPSRVPDLFAGRPVVVTGRFDGDPDAAVRVRGTAAGRRVEAAVSGAGLPGRIDRRALPAVWARLHIAELLDHAAWSPNRELPEQIRQVALSYGLMSVYTAFVAVDSSRVTAGDHGTTVPVPVPVPDGVRYETTVRGGG